MTASLMTTMTRIMKSIKERCSRVAIKPVEKQENEWRGTWQSGKMCRRWRSRHDTSKWKKRKKNSRQEQVADSTTFPLYSPVKNNDRGGVSMFKLKQSGDGVANNYWGRIKDGKYKTFDNNRGTNETHWCDKASWLTWTIERSSRFLIWLHLIYFLDMWCISKQSLSAV